MIESKILKIGKLKDGRKYTSSNYFVKLWNNFLKIISNQSKYNDSSVNELSLKEKKYEI